MTREMPIDPRKSADYATPKAPAIIDVQPAPYLVVEGQGEPGGEQFAEKMGALFNVAHTVKFARKKLGQDFKLGAVEGLWWTTAGGSDWREVAPDEWRWKLLVRVADFIEARDVAEAVAALRRKKKQGPFDQVRLETIHEGPSVQMLHVGSYATETTTLDQMDAFVAAQGLEYHGAHHEIYLSDPRRVPPERLRTILRHPVRLRAA